MTTRLYTPDDIEQSPIEGAPQPFRVVSVADAMANAWRGRCATPMVVLDCMLISLFVWSAVALAAAFGAFGG